MNNETKAKLVAEGWNLVDNNELDKHTELQERLAKQSLWTECARCLNPVMPSRDAQCPVCGKETR